MTSVEKTIREIARKLLDEKKVDVVIGYERGTLPMRSTPCFISDVKEVERLIWDVTCENNLAKYLIGRKGKVGIVAKGCDSRSIVAFIAEKQIDPNTIFVIGVPCSGVIDSKKVEAALTGKDIQEVTLEDNFLRIRDEDVERNLPIQNFLDNSCLSCNHRNPTIYNVLACDKVQDQMNNSVKTPLISEIERKSVDARWEYFTNELKKCIRCYACRNVCPLCYCQECFVDQNSPTWLGKTDNISDTMIYHIVRIFHVAGRCVDCGACSRGCPMGIDLRTMIKKMGSIVKDLYGFEAGLNPEEAPPLTTFRQDDNQDFIK